MLSGPLCVCVAALLAGVAAYPFEVPASACVDMTPKGPGHNEVAPQKSKMPFDLSVKRVGNDVEFTISAKSGGPPFAAFMVQARAGKSTTPLGTFTPKGNNARTVKCSAENDTGSHNSPDPKKSVTLIWTPPTDYKGAVRFYATVAETKHKFWVRQKGATVAID